MGANGEVWRLYRGSDLLGEITVEGSDFPWLHARFSAQPAFAEVRPLFERELAHVEVDGDLDVAAWEATYQAITQTISLVAPSGPVAEFLLHVRGEDAWVPVERRTIRLPQTAGVCGADRNP
jgi:hypothetical protein